MRLFAGLIVASSLIPFMSMSASENEGLTMTPALAKRKSPCPPEMAQVGAFCIDRWEVHTVENRSRKRLSPYYPPESRLLKKVYRYWSTEAARTGDARARLLPLPPIPLHQRGPFTPRAVSAPRVLPQGYMTYYSARLACKNAGKRLCSEKEWVRACRGSKGTRHPYSDRFKAHTCNVFRAIHPAYELHGNSSLGHLDPRLHLVTEEGKSALLLPTGSKPKCVSVHQSQKIYDMVGNLDEWIDDPKGTFVGGFFSRPTREGCEAKVENHAPAYTDYSLGTRCCRALR